MIYAGIHTYTTHVGTIEQLHAWEGDQTVFFYPTQIPEDWAETVLGYSDHCIQLYRQISGQPWPTGWYPQFPGKAPLAVVQHTCGAGCGSQGIAEILWSEHEDAVRRMGSFTDPITWQVGFYEFGRQGSYPDHPTFPCFRALDHTPTHDLIASAFPEYVAGQAIVAAGRSLEDQRHSYLTQGYHRVPGPLEYRSRFLASGWSFQQTLDHDHPTYSRNWPLTSLLTHLDLRYGKSFMGDLIACLNHLGQAHQVTNSSEIIHNCLEAVGNVGGSEAQNYLRHDWRMIPGAP